MPEERPITVKIKAPGHATITLKAPPLADLAAAIAQEIVSDLWDPDAPACLAMRPRTTVTIRRTR